VDDRVHAAEGKTSLPRTNFSQGALYEVGSALTLFSVKSHAAEFRRALESAYGTAPDSIATGISDIALAEDEPNADRIEETTRDFVVRELSTELKGHPFAEFVADLLRAMGYRTQISPEGPDRGVDIVAHRDELGLEPPIIKVQVKSSQETVAPAAVQSLLGTLAANERGLFVTLGRFSDKAGTLGKDRSNLRLIDASQLVDLIFEYYDRLDGSYKSKLPLRSVYVPDPPEP